MSAVEESQKTWTTPELLAEFNVIGFQAPYVVVVRKADDTLGSMEFTHNPRLYFNWVPHEPEEEVRMTDDLQPFRDTVVKYGWGVIGVFPTEDKPASGLPFSYTYGLTEFGHPEIIVVAVDGRTGHSLLNLLGEQVRAGRKFQHGDRPEQVLAGGYTPVLIDVSDPFGDEYPMSIAGQLYGWDIPALQLVLPDKNHRFPWEPDCTEGFPQPVLGPLLGLVPTTPES